MSMVLNIGEVVSVMDDSDGLRIKAFTVHDKGISIEDLPYAFPLMPKTFQTVPKKGEAVLLIYSELDNNRSQRYYIGPIISQPQQMNEAPFKKGKGLATSLIQGAEMEPLPKLSQFAETDGAFPSVGDVAMVGRAGEDIILKEGEVDIRCGVRTKAIDSGDGLTGNVIFNGENPAYIQLKQCNSKNGETYVNVVSDKINLISHNFQPSQNVNLTNPSSDTSRTNENLIREQDFEHIMKKLHQVPYGDVLVE